MNEFHIFLDCAELRAVPRSLHPTHPELSEDAIDGTIVVLKGNLTYFGGMHESHHRRLASREGSQGAVVVTGALSQAHA